MAGNQDSDLAVRGEALRQAIYDVAEAKLIECAAAIEVAKADDLAQAQVVARAVGVLMRAGAAAYALSQSRRRTRSREDDDDDMRDEPRDDSPENLERLRADIGAHVERLIAIAGEVKSGDSDGGRTARPAPYDVGAARPSKAA